MIIDSSITYNHYINQENENFSLTTKTEISNDSAEYLQNIKVNGNIENIFPYCNARVTFPSEKIEIEKIFAPNFCALRILNNGDFIIPKGPLYLNNKELNSDRQFVVSENVFVDIPADNPLTFTCSVTNDISKLTRTWFQDKNEIVPKSSNIFGTSAIGGFGSSRSNNSNSFGGFSFGTSTSSTSGSNGNNNSNTAANLGFSFGTSGTVHGPFGRDNSSGFDFGGSTFGSSGSNTSFGSSNSGNNSPNNNNSSPGFSFGSSSSPSTSSSVGGENNNSNTGFSFGASNNPNDPFGPIPNSGRDNNSSGFDFGGSTFGSSGSNTSFGSNSGNNSPNNKNSSPGFSFGSTSSPWTGSSVGGENNNSNTGFSFGASNNPNDPFGPIPESDSGDSNDSTSISFGSNSGNNSSTFGKASFALEPDNNVSNTNSSNLFGGSSNSSGFGSNSSRSGSNPTNTSPFGGASNSTNSSPSYSSGFGGSIPTSTSSFGGGSNPNTSPFGSASNSTNTSSFGGGSIPTSTSSFGGGINPNTRPFGGASTASTSVFGGRSSNSSAFGSNTTNSGLFCGPNSANTSTNPWGSSRTANNANEDKYSTFDENSVIGTGGFTDDKNLNIQTNTTTTTTQNPVNNNSNATIFSRNRFGRKMPINHILKAKYQQKGKVKIDIKIKNSSENDAKAIFSLNEISKISKSEKVIQDFDEMDISIQPSTVEHGIYPHLKGNYYVTVPGHSKVTISFISDVFEEFIGDNIFLIFDDFVHSLTSSDNVVKSKHLPTVLQIQDLLTSKPLEDLCDYAVDFAHYLTSVLDDMKGGEFDFTPTSSEMNCLTPIIKLFVSGYTQPIYTTDKVKFVCDFDALQVPDMADTIFYNSQHHRDIFKNNSTVSGQTTSLFGNSQGSLFGSGQATSLFGNSGNSQGSLFGSGQATSLFGNSHNRPFGSANNQGGNTFGSVNARFGGNTFNTDDGARIHATEALKPSNLSLEESRFQYLQQSSPSSFSFGN